MGYRSEVAMMVIREDKENAPTIPEVMAMAKAKGILDSEVLNGERWSTEDFGWDDDRFLFHVDWVKWYESFPEVQALNDLYQFFEEMNVDESSAERGWFSGKFVRVGEELDDNEEKAFGNGWDYDSIGLTRSVYVEDQLGLLGNQNKLTGVNK